MKRILFCLLLAVLSVGVTFEAESAKKKKRKRAKTVKVFKPKVKAKHASQISRVIPYRQLVTYNTQSAWVDSVFNSLTPDQRIAQLITVRAYSNKDQAHVNEILEYVTKYNVGGIIFFQGGPMRQAHLTNLYQKYAQTPILISIDGEWGLSMRLDSTMSFPRAMMLGAMDDDSLIYLMGREIALQMRSIGIHINFAPVVDINNNPLNPIISNRSFGESKYDVAHKGYLYMKGMQDYGLLTTIKHFPGHGDTYDDSHLKLPLLNFDTTRLDTLELYPFKQLLSQNASGVMVGHLSIPALDTTRNQPSSLSYNIITKLLRKKLKYNGLIYTDALAQMKGVTDYMKAGDIEVKALQAGVDVLLMPQDVPKAIKSIREAITEGRLRQTQVDSSCRKILAAKEWLGLKHFYPVNTAALKENLSTPQANLIQRRIANEGITVVQNQNNLIPLKNLDTLRAALVLIGAEKNTRFSEMMNLYDRFDTYYLSKKADSISCDTLVNRLRKYNLVVAGIVNTDYKPTKNFGIAPNAAHFLNDIVLKNNVILSLFATPYYLSSLQNIDKYKSIIVSFEDLPTIQEYTAQLIFGAVAAKGKLPVTATPFVKNTGINTETLDRLSYQLPEEIGIDSKPLKQIDSIVMDGIRKKAMPGCQVLAAKDGIVFYNKAFGKTAYDSTAVPVTLNTIYDIASITKIAGTLPVIMKLYEDEKIDLDDKLADYLPDMKHSNKKNTKLIDILTHQAQFQPFIPFYMRTIEPANPAEKLSPTNVKFKEGLFSKVADSKHNIQVADSMFLLNAYRDSIWQITANSPLLPSKKYTYSDISFYYMFRIAETVSEMPINRFNDSVFYRPMGMSYMGYRPLERFDRSRIAPTENDQLFRRQVLRGYVHDPGAAMLGGIGGHAGLFANANDVAKLMQMYLENGEYGGIRYLDSATVRYFNSAPFAAQGNRRGLGFDKASADPKNSPVAAGFSLESFGHSGFSGCITWADPKTGLLFVFLSNRINPDVSNEKLKDMSIRTHIQEILIKSVEGK